MLVELPDSLAAKPISLDLWTVITMSYAARYVAFVDILGFRQIIEKSANSQQMVEGLAKALKSISDRNTDLERTLGVDFKSQTFSDFIIMSETVSDRGLSHLFYQIQELALSLLAKGILIRGGICRGNLYHEGSVVFGPAILESYRLESSVANVPRVVLDANVYSDVVRYGNDDDRWKRDFEADLRFCDDGPVHVHVLKRLSYLNRQRPDIVDTDEVVQGQFCQSALQGLITVSMHEPRHFEKVKWFVIYWNSTVPSGETNAPLTMVRLPYMLKQ